MTTMFRRQLQHTRLLRESRRARAEPCRLCKSITLIVLVWVVVLLLITPAVWRFLTSWSF